VTRTIIVVLAAELTAVIPPRNLVGETQTCRQQCESDPFLNTSRKTRGRTSTRPCPIFTSVPPQFFSCRQFLSLENRLPCGWSSVLLGQVGVLVAPTGRWLHSSPFFRIIVLSSTSRQARGIKTVLKYNSARVESHASGYLWAKIGAAFLSTEILVAVAPTWPKYSARHDSHEDAERLSRRRAYRRSARQVDQTAGDS